MMIVSQFRQVALSYRELKAYAFVGMFVLGNLILPQLCHFFPDGGKIWLPIYFFTLIASYKFGLKVGLLTAICSPLCNYALFGMPPAAVLPVLLVKSSLLAVCAWGVAAHTKSLSLLHIALVVVAYQVLGGLAEWGLTGSWEAAVQDFRLGYLGMVSQVVLGWWMLKGMATYGWKKL